MFDVEQFIECIQERPVLWDRRLKEYSDRVAREEAWREVGGVMFKNWHSLDSEEKDDKVKEMKNKWRHIRDNFQKFLNQKKVTERKGKADGSLAKKKKYVYADNLMFLQDTLKNRKTTENYWADDFDEEQEKKEIGEFSGEEKIKSEIGEFGEEDKSNSSSSRLGASGQQNDSQVISLALKDNLTRLAPKLHKNQNELSKSKQASPQASPKWPVPEREPRSEEIEDADRSFLLSLLPDLKKLDDDEKLDFKVMTLQFFRDVRCKRKFPFSSSAATSSTQFAAESCNESSSEAPPHMFQHVPVVSMQTSIPNQAFLNFCAMMGQNSRDQNSNS